MSADFALTMNDTRHFDSNELEQMDEVTADASSLERTLKDLEKMNRLLGGHRYAVKFLKKRVPPGRNYRILDIGTGGGDFPRAMVNWARKTGVNLEVDAIDAGGTIIEIAQKLSAGYPEISYKTERAQNLKGDRHYDLVHCSLSMHHFSTADAVAVLRRCRELSREFVLITDLERSLRARVGVHIANTLFRNGKMTVADGDTSAARAFSFREFRLLAKGAKWPSFGHERFGFCRQALWTPHRNVSEAAAARFDMPAAQHVGI